MAKLSRPQCKLLAWFPVLASWRTDENVSSSAVSPIDSNQFTFGNGTVTDIYAQFMLTGSTGFSARTSFRWNWRNLWVEHNIYHAAVELPSGQKITYLDEKSRFWDTWLMLLALVKYFCSHSKPYVKHSIHILKIVKPTLLLN